jgi:hypothetical protein
VDEKRCTEKKRRDVRGAQCNGCLDNEISQLQRNHRRVDVCKAGGNDGATTPKGRMRCAASTGLH